MYEVVPLECPQCGGVMKIVSFIERCRADAIERILRHCGLWEGPVRTLAGGRAPPGLKPCSAEPRELELVLDAEFLEFQRLERQQAEPRELQFVLDPEFLRSMAEAAFSAASPAGPLSYEFRDHSIDFGAIRLQAHLTAR